MRVLSCIEEDGEKRVNMAHLAIIGNFSIWGTILDKVYFVGEQLVTSSILLYLIELI